MHEFSEVVGSVLDCLIIEVRSKSEDGTSVSIAFLLLGPDREIIGTFRSKRAAAGTARRNFESRSVMGPQA